METRKRQCGERECVGCSNENGDCSLVRRFCSPKVRESEIKGSSFRRFCSPKVRKSDNDFSYECKLSLNQESLSYVIREA